MTHAAAVRLAYLLNGSILSVENFLQQEGNMRRMRAPKLDPLDEILDEVQPRSRSAPSKSQSPPKLSQSPKSIAKRRPLVRQRRRARPRPS